MIAWNAILCKVIQNGVSIIQFYTKLCHWFTILVGLPSFRKQFLDKHDQGSTCYMWCEARNAKHETRCALRRKIKMHNVRCKLKYQKVKVISRRSSYIFSRVYMIIFSVSLSHKLQAFPILRFISNIIFQIIMNEQPSLIFHLGLWNCHGNMDSCN